MPCPQLHTYKWSGARLNSGLELFSGEHASLQQLIRACLGGYISGFPSLPKHPGHLEGDRSLVLGLGLGTCILDPSQGF